MIKKHLAIMLSLLMLLTSLAACGNGGESNTTDGTTTAPGETTTAENDGESAVQGEEITLWHYFSGPDADEFERFVGKYNDENTLGSKVVSTFVNRDDLMKQYTMGAVSGELPNIGMVDNPDMASFIEMGVYEDITDLVDEWGEAEQFFEGPLNSCIRDGRIYGLPHNSNALALVYNKTMFEEAGIDKVPENWEELEDAAEKLTTDSTYGIAFAMPKHEEGTFQFMPWLLSAGGDIYELDSPESIRALTFITDLINNGYASKDVINWSQADANAQFYSQNAAMQINGPWNMPVIQEEAPDLDFGVTLVPKDKEYASVLGGENFGICKGAPIEASFDFLTYIMDAENNAEFCENGGKFPPRKDSAESREIWTEDEIYSVFAGAVAVAQPRGPSPVWPQISSAITTAMHASFTGEMAPEAAMVAAAAEVAALD